METKLNIIIGQGLGPLQFGATEEEITEIFGAPDETENDKESNTLTMFYDGIMTDFVLEPDEDDDTFRLSSILTSNPDYSIDNKSNSATLRMLLSNTPKPSKPKHLKQRPIPKQTKNTFTSTTSTSWLFSTTRVSQACRLARGTKTTKNKPLKYISL